MHNLVWVKAKRDYALCILNGQARRLAPRIFQCIVGASQGQSLYNSKSQGKGLELPDYIVHAMKCGIRARGPRSTHGEYEKKVDLKDDVLFSVYLTKC